MSTMKKINVSIHEIKGQAAAAEMTYCERSDECPLYAKGKCILCKQFMRSETCPYGKVEFTRGYTRRAKKYGEFMRAAKSDDAYEKLGNALQRILVVPVGDYVYLSLGSVVVRYEPDEKKRGDSFMSRLYNGVAITDALMFVEGCWLPKKLVTPALMKAVCERVPFGFNGRMDGYQERDVPRIVEELMKNLPDVYEGLVEIAPRYKDVKFDYVGRRAFLKTLRDGIEIRTSNGTFVRVGDELVCDGFDGGILMTVAGMRVKNARVVVPIPDDATVEVGDNDWVTEGTRFA